MFRTPSSVVEVATACVDRPADKGGRRQTHLGTPEIKVEDILYAFPRSSVDPWKGKSEVSKVCSILLKNIKLL